MWITIIIYVCTGVVFLLAYQNSKKISFQAAAGYLAGKLIHSSRCFHNYYKKIADSLECLQPGKDREQLYRQYLEELIMLVLAVVLAGSTAAGIIRMQEIRNSRTEQYYVKRGDYGEGRTERFLVEAEGFLEQTEIVVSLQARAYTGEQAKQFLTEASGLIEELMLGENDSLDEVRNDLVFFSKFPELPVTVKWIPENTEVLDNKGVIQDAVPEEGVLTTVRAILTCGEYEQDSQIVLCVYPRTMSEEELLMTGIAEELLIRDEAEKTKEQLELPVEVDGKILSWSKQEENDSIWILCLGIVAAAALWIGKNKELDKKMEQRKKQMLEDYAEVMGKMALFLGAGMPVKRAWGEIVKAYENQKKQGRGQRYVYEEMMITYHEIQSGVSELRAYEQFGQRCRVQQYLKFSSLLVQNLRKGTAGFTQIMTAESQAAFEERKNIARKAGEETGTKLLMPMLCMLGVVLVIVMVPAFMSFQL